MLMFMERSLYDRRKVGASQALPHLSSRQPCEMDTDLILILQKKKLTLGEVR